MFYDLSNGLVTFLPYVVRLTVALFQNKLLKVSKYCIRITIDSE